MLSPHNGIYRDLSNQDLLAKISKRLMAYVELDDLRTELIRRIGQIDTLESENGSLKNQIKLLLCQLEDSETNKTEFLSNIKNQLNNPLNSVLVLSKHLVEQLDGQHLSVARMINDEVLILDFQLRNLLMSSELEAGEAVLEAGTFNLNQLIDESVRVFSKRIHEKNIIIHTKSLPNLSVSTDRYKLAVILQNLISNAIEFNRENGSISIFVESKKGKVSIKVNDEGIGFSKDEAGLIFIRFKQLESLPSRPHVSGGLGLSLVKSLVEILDGDIRFISKPDKGSTFTLTFPCNICKNSEQEMDQSGIFFEV